MILDQQDEIQFSYNQLTYNATTESNYFRGIRPTPHENIFRLNNHLFLKNLKSPSEQLGVVIKIKSNNKPKSVPLDQQESAG